MGPGGAAEQVPRTLDHRRFLAGDRRQRAERFDDPDRLELVPDWERVMDLVMTDPQARLDWSWLVLPLRWGYPATRSPFAGIISHAETGNLAPLGPAYNDGWNRVGPTLDYADFSPHWVESIFPLGWQDNFLNSWGFLNLTLPTLASLPPFDFLWQVVGAPVRLLVRRQLPTYYPGETMQSRLAGVTGGISLPFFSDDFVFLLTGPAQFEEIAALERDTLSAVRNRRVEVVAAPVAQFNFYVGVFKSENMVQRVRTRLRADLADVTTNEVTPLSGGLDFWEYAGSLRYNLLSGAWLPFVKVGYGLSWYRVTDAAIAGEPLEDGTLEWVRRPSLLPPRHLFPNTWHVGAGFELIPVRSFAPLPWGIDVGLRADYGVFLHKLGLGRPLLATDLQDFAVSRGAASFQLTLSF